MPPVDPGQHNDPKSPARRPLQFSLRLMLVVTAVVALALGLCVPFFRSPDVPTRIVPGPAPWSSAVADRDGKLIELSNVRQEEFCFSGIRLWFGDVADRDLVPLQNMTNLERLNLDQAKVTDAGLAHLTGLKSLRWLDLDGTQITDAGLVHLEKLPNLTGLSLGGTQITDAGVANLTRLGKLQWLHLSGTRVTPEGVAQLRRGLPATRIGTD